MTHITHLGSIDLGLLCIMTNSHLGVHLSHWLLPSSSSLRVPRIHKAVSFCRRILTPLSGPFVPFLPICRHFRQLPRWSILAVPISIFRRLSLDVSRCIEMDMRDLQPGALS